MNKQEFIKLWAANAGVTQKDAEKYYEAFVECVASGLKQDGKIQLIGFGNFELKTKAARTGVKNPLKEGAFFDIPASKAPTFKAASKFKEKFN